MIGVSTAGDNNKTSRALAKMKRQHVLSDLDRYGERGVQLLAAATPVETGLTANSWAYRIVQEPNGPRIEWYNTNGDGTVSIVILIQYGHATRSGTFIAGRDFINPAIQPLFDEIASEIWKKVIS